MIAEKLQFQRLFYAILGMERCLNIQDRVSLRFAPSQRHCKAAIYVETGMDNHVY